MKKLLFILMLCSGLAKSQAELIIPFFASSSAPSLSPSITEWSLYNTTVRNQSAVYSFNDTLYVYVGVRDSLNQVQVMDIVNKGLRTVNISDSIVVDTIAIDVNPVFFQEGNNTVVIWPAAPNTLTIDSLEFSFVYNSVNDLLGKNIPVTIGPNPASDLLFLGDPQNLVKQVRIRNLNGTIVERASTNTIVDLSNLSNGVYVLELITPVGIATRKLIIQH